MKFLTDPNWWFTSCFMGFAMSLAASYVKPLLDGWLSKASERWARRTSEKRKLDDAMIERVRTATDERKILVACSTILGRLRAATYLALAIIPLVTFFAIRQTGNTAWDTNVVVIVLEFMFAACLGLGLTYHLAATRVESILRREASLGPLSGRD